MTEAKRILIYDRMLVLIDSAIWRVTAKLEFYPGGPWNYEWARIDVRDARRLLEHLNTPKGDQPRFERGREGIGPAVCESAAGRGVDSPLLSPRSPTPATARQTVQREEGLFTQVAEP